MTVSDCRDFEDDRILECAIASGSDLIVSDDIDLLEMSPWRGIPVLTSSDFVQRTDAMRRSRGPEVSEPTTREAPGAVEVLAKCDIGFIPRVRRTPTSSYAEAYCRT